MSEQEVATEVGNFGAVPEVVKPDGEALPDQVESKEAVIAGLQKALAEKESELAVSKQALVEAGEKLTALETALAGAVANYKTLVIESNPGVLAELITGSSVDEVNASLRNAQAIISRVRQEMEAEASKTRVPAGAPQRSPLDLSILSPREKIQYAIGGKK